MFQTTSQLLFFIMIIMIIIIIRWPFGAYPHFQTPYPATAHRMASEEIPWLSNGQSVNHRGLWTLPRGYGWKLNYATYDSQMFLLLMYLVHCYSMLLISSHAHAMFQNHPWTHPRDALPLLSNPTDSPPLPTKWWSGTPIPGEMNVICSPTIGWFISRSIYANVGNVVVNIC